MHAANRFEDTQNLLRILTTVVILVFFTIYCASGVVAGARLFENMFGLPYQTALWVGAALAVNANEFTEINQTTAGPELALSKVFLRPLLRLQRQRRIHQL